VTPQRNHTFGDGADDEKPVHEVCVGDFYMGETEVTQKQWKDIMGDTPSYFKNCDECPVEKVSWNNIQRFIKKLNQKTTPSIPLNNRGERVIYRLPTEAEWEYAARSGGKKEKYAGGDDIDIVAWHGSNSGGKTHPVKQKKPNGLGLYDMSGNVWEWVQDWYDKNYYENTPKDNPKGPDSGLFRVNRGGGWYYSAGHLRNSHRDDYTSDSRSYDLGFRLAGSIK